MQTFTDLRGQSRPPSDLPLFDAPATVRTFDSPEFRDVTFYEVEAKSILNRVPAASRMPFEWTINVYRGCSHACSYCLAGDTPILMANGRTKPLADVRAGDTIYGTDPRRGLPPICGHERARPLVDREARLPGHAGGRDRAGDER